MSISDISSIGAFGGFTVNELPAKTRITKDGNTLDGCNIMMTFNKEIEDKVTGKKITIGHAVIVTGTDTRDGKQGLTFFDPTTQQDGFREMDNWTALFSVQDTYSAGITNQEGVR